MLYLAEVDWNAIFSTSNMPLIAVFGTATIVSVCSVYFGARYMAKKSEHETHLKRDLVAKGYTADEIERIVRASPNARQSKK